MGTYKENIPKADMLMGSMRSMGYSFESAIADVIDNSISAGCSFVSILFPTDPFQKQAVGILDDGCGLSREELFEAMCYGSSSAEATRAESDLGRFGLGLKAASLSQCRVLTVASMQDGVICAYSWDYNYILKHKKWYVNELTEKEIADLPYIENLKDTGSHKGSATLVIWEDFDVLSKSSSGQVFSTLRELSNKVQEHVSLIFHRYISAKKLTMWVNNAKVQAQDPFLEYPGSKTTIKKVRTVALRDSQGIERLIEVQPFVLPFATDLTDKDKKLLGGIENLRTKQGFYIYRNKRLIIWGTWFGLKKNELTKNARVRVDIPNSLDDIWGIDIKKQNATIPKAIQNQLKKTVEEAMDISVKKQTHRGRKDNSEDTISHIWDRMKGRNDAFYYQINRESPLCKYVFERIPDDVADVIETLLSEIEKGIPVQDIYIDRCNEAIAVEDKAQTLDDDFQLAITIIDLNLKRGTELNTAIDNIMQAEPWCVHPQLKDMLLKYYSHEDK